MKATNEINKLNCWINNNITITVNRDEGGIKHPRFYLYDGNAPVDLSNATVVYKGTKSNGSAVYTDISIINTTSALVELPIINGLTDIRGILKGEIDVISEDGTLAFGGINLNVMQGTSDKAIEASEVFTVLVDKLMEVDKIVNANKSLIDIRRFGAKENDPATDNAGAILKAIEYASVENGRVYIPPATFYVDSTIPIRNKENLTIINDGVIYAKSKELRDNKFTTLFSCEQCKNLNFTVGTIKSDRDKLSKAPVNYTRKNLNGSNIIGVHINNCEDVVIDDYTADGLEYAVVINADEDGVVSKNIVLKKFKAFNTSQPIYGAHFEDFSINEIYCESCPDCGLGDHFIYISRCSKNLLVNSARFVYTDTNYGVAINLRYASSSAGVDNGVLSDEYDASKDLNEAYIFGVDVENCEQFLSAKAKTKVYVENCTINSSVVSSRKCLFLEEYAELYVKNSSFIFSDDNPLLSIGNNASHNVTFNNCTIKVGFLFDIGSNSATDKDVFSKNIAFLNCNIVCTSNTMSPIWLNCASEINVSFVNSKLSTNRFYTFYVGNDNVRYSIIGTEFIIDESANGLRLIYTPYDTDNTTGYSPNDNVQVINCVCRNIKRICSSQNIVDYNNLIFDKEGNVISNSGTLGKDGEDGYSPTATVTQTDIGAVITITDESGTTTARVTNGADGKDGANGTNGKDGVSCTHSWNGTTLTVTSASGTSSVNLKGDKGDTGAKGADGSDYILTNSDKSEIATAVKTDLAQLEPLFANTIEQCTDISKVYVLPDGYIYAYMATATEGTSTPNFTNLMDDPNAYIKEGYRYSHSGQAFKEQATDCSIVIPIPSGSPIIRVRGAGNNATYNNYVYVSYGADDGVFEVSNENWTRTVEDNGDIVITMNYDLSSSGYATFAVASGVDIDDLIVTVNEEISYTTTEGGVVYDWKNTGHAFVPTDYEDRIINVENEVKANGDKISELEDEISKPAPTGIVTMFISPTGDDSNDGLTASYPKKTVKACVEAGATRISAKRGTYNEEISLSNIDTLEIFPTDNNYTNKDVHRYPPIVFDTSDTIAVDSLVDYNAIKSVAYSKQNKAFSYVFTNGLYDTVYSTIHGYHSVIWLITNNIKTDKKLRPVASISEVESNADTFTYIDNMIYLNADLTNVQEIRVPTSYNNAFTVSTANKVKLTEVEINFAGRYNLFIENCPVVEIDNCSVKYSSNGSGFDLKSANGILRNCYASRVHDGYGIGGCGHTVFIDCTAEWCFDDGMSHHTKCTGTVIGGRFEGNRKGGNVPAYGANVNIYGGLYKDNQMYGIAYITDSTHQPSTGMVQGAVIVGNDKGLVVGDTCNVTVLNCSYSDNNSDKDVTGELIEY